MKLKIFILSLILSMPVNANSLKNASDLSIGITSGYCSALIDLMEYNKNIRTNEQYLFTISFLQAKAKIIQLDSISKLGIKCASILGEFDIRTKATKVIKTVKEK